MKQICITRLIYFRWFFQLQQSFVFLYDFSGEVFCLRWFWTSYFFSDTQLHLSAVCVLVTKFHAPSSAAPTLILLVCELPRYSFWSCLFLLMFFIVNKFCGTNQSACPPGIPYLNTQVRREYFFMRRD